MKIDTFSEAAHLRAIPLNSLADKANTHSFWVGIMPMPFEGVPKTPKPHELINN